MNKYTFGDDEEASEQWQIGKTVTFKIPHVETYYPSLSYRYIRLGDKYGFSHTDCKLADYHLYFETIKKICSQSIKDWQSLGPGKNHNFKIEVGRPTTILLDMLKEISGKSNLTEKEIPMTGHFHLSERESASTKGQVVHFFLGEKGEFFLLAFDLAHEIHPTKS